MASLPVKLTVFAIALAFIVAAAIPAHAAEARKHKKHTAHTAEPAANSKYRGTNLVPAGPVYNGPDYLGDDPDPNIRFQLYRDLGAHYGGES